MGTTRFPHGITNTSVDTTLGTIGQPDPSQYHTYWEDFDYYTAGDWTITVTQAGSGSASEASRTIMPITTRYFSIRWVLVSR